MTTNRYRNSPEIGGTNAPYGELADQELALLCKALAHPARIRLLRLLIVRKSCVCGELVDAMPLSQSTVSEHLRILKQAGLIQSEVDGSRVFYCVNLALLERLKKLIALL